MYCHRMCCGWLKVSEEGLTFSPGGILLRSETPGGRLTPGGYFLRDRSIDQRNCSSIDTLEGAEVPLFINITMYFKDVEIAR